MTMDAAAILAQVQRVVQDITGGDTVTAQQPLMEVCAASVAMFDV